MWATIRAFFMSVLAVVSPQNDNYLARARLPASALADTTNSQTLWTDVPRPAAAARFQQPPTAKPGRSIRLSDASSSDTPERQTKPSKL